ncbi:hypothetical protein TWF281_011657 [Arthrobotrys megalospora]
MSSRSIILTALLFISFSASVLGMPGVEIAFVPLQDPDCRLRIYDFVKLEPSGCHSAMLDDERWFVGSIRIRTAYPYLDDIPSAIGIYDGDCTKAQIRFIIFPYQLQFVDQEVRLVTYPFPNVISSWDLAKYPEYAGYQVLKEGSKEWKELLDGPDRPRLPTNEGDVLYKDKFGKWEYFPNKLQVYPVYQWGKPSHKGLSLYQKGVGVRPPKFENLNMMLGTLERQSPNSPDAVLARPRLGDGGERPPVSIPDTQGGWRGTEANPLIPEWPKEPSICGEPTLKFSARSSEMSAHVNDMVSPGLFRGNRETNRGPLQIPSARAGPNQLRAPNTRLPKVHNPSVFSPSRSKSQAPEDFDWDVLRPQRPHQAQDETPNRLGERLRESAERDESISEIPEELAPGEKIQVDKDEIDYEPLLAGLGLAPFSSDFRSLASPLLPLEREPESPFIKPVSSTPRVNAVVFDSDPDLDSQYFQ